MANGIGPNPGAQPNVNGGAQVNPPQVQGAQGNAGVNHVVNPVYGNPALANLAQLVNNAQAAHIAVAQLAHQPQSAP